MPINRDKVRGQRANFCVARPRDFRLARNGRHVDFQARTRALRAGPFSLESSNCRVSAVPPATPTPMCGAIDSSRGLTRMTRGNVFGSPTATGLSLFARRSSTRSRSKRNRSDGVKVLRQSRHALKRPRCTVCLSCTRKTCFGSRFCARCA